MLNTQQKPSPCDACFEMVPADEMTRGGEDFSFCNACTDREHTAPTIKMVASCPRCSGEGESRQLVSGVNCNDPNAEYATFECEACDGKGWLQVTTTDDADGKELDVINDLARDEVTKAIGHDWNLWTRPMR